MSRRYSDAIAIQNGACNPSGIAHAFINGCNEIFEEHGGTDIIRNDPALRLIAHQLCYLMNISEIENSHSVYCKLLNECEICRSKAKPALTDTSET